MDELLVGVENVVPTVVIGDADVEEEICLTRMFRDLATWRSFLFQMKVALFKNKRTDKEIH